MALVSFGAYYHSKYFDSQLI
ncbi:hypothetical protein CCACVL1_00336 [Corchorus capsularis]|uniref:Uncharacterized protein n=1 Tax=Corchorus capsularis TaxID=210143 RepID=A0A1R3KX58_COCAP|nr:hypothetical protein CCACVL1_00336 [Corchorus capsularis]